MIHYSDACIYHAAISREKKKERITTGLLFFLRNCSMIITRIPRESCTPAVDIHADAGFPIFASKNSVKTRGGTVKEACAKILQITLKI